MNTDEIIQGYLPEDRHVPTFRTRLDALRYLALHFGRTVHVYESAWTCLVCGARFDSLAQGQAVPCAPRNDL